MFSGAASVGGSTRPAPLFKQVNLSVDSLDVFGERYQNLSTIVEPGSEAWEISLSGEKAKGRIDVPYELDNDKNPVKANFDKLYLGKLSTSAPVKATPSLNFSASSLEKAPALSVVVNELYWNDKSLGKLMIDTMPAPGGIQFSRISLSMPTLTINLTGSWRTIVTYDQIQMHAELKGSDYGNALTNLGYPDIFDNAQGAVVTTGSWRGSLLNPDLSTLNGDLAFDLSDGSLKGVNPGISRLLGLFSIETLMNHLRLSFKDVNESGMTFTHLVGQYHVKNGIASTQDFKIDSPSLTVMLTGDIDLVHKTMNQKIIAKPNVDAGIALAAGLIGGPLVAVASWAADKLLSNTLFRNQGFEYDLKGKWGSEETKVLKKPH
ncbi:MAG: hypothetical protein EBX40_07835 [Gammaproteobacteria bacterium]|nr:hypothetical protein [Gammaproteobacteria bacterium]